MDFSPEFADGKVEIYISEAKGDINLKINIITRKAENCCFVQGTPVWLADGIKKNIEDVVVGDVVLSYNESTKNYEYNKVVNTIINPNATNIARVSLVNGTTIEMNEYHPIYTEEGWKSLTNYNDFPTLTENDKILSINSEFIEIASIETWEEKEPITTYNLSIENNHNYFVGETAVLVHNATSCPT